LIRNAGAALIYTEECSLPHRQLRKHLLMSPEGLPCSLPHRQLRKKPGKIAGPDVHCRIGSLAFPSWGIKSPAMKAASYARGLARKIFEMGS
jgi:hypothetical protein